MRAKQSERPAKINEIRRTREHAFGESAKDFTRANMAFGPWRLLSGRQEFIASKAKQSRLSRGCDPLVWIASLSLAMTKRAVVSLASPDASVAPIFS
jgi:hypothetical protein